MGNKIQKQCRICGKTFTPCSNCENDESIFHWRKFACSTKCAKEYFSKIEKSRQLKNINTEFVDANKEESSEVILNATDNTDCNKSKKNKRRNVIENKESE